jgi:hypothetical protein
MSKITAYLKGHNLPVWWCSAICALDSKELFMAHEKSAA